MSGNSSTPDLFLNLFSKFFTTYPPFLTFGKSLLPEYKKAGARIFSVKAT